jgi:hypothetical protein
MIVMRLETTSFVNEMLFERKERMKEKGLKV